MHEQGKIQIPFGFLLYFLLVGFFLSNSAHAVTIGLPKYTYTNETTGEEMSVQMGSYPNIYGNKVNIYYYVIQDFNPLINPPPQWISYILLINQTEPWDAPNHNVAIGAVSRYETSYNIMSACPWLGSYYYSGGYIPHSSHQGLCGVYTACLAKGTYKLQVASYSSFWPPSAGSYYSWTINVVSTSCSSTCPTVGQKGCISSTKQWECIQLACCKANVTTTCQYGCSAGACLTSPPPPPDTTPPTTTSYYATGCQPLVSVSLTCSDGFSYGRSGCAGTYYCIANYQGTCTPNIAYPGLISINSADPKTVRFYSKDNAGNIESVKSVDVNVCPPSPPPPPPPPPPQVADVTPPVTPASFPSECQATTEVTLACTDDLSGCAATYYCIGSSCAPSSIYSNPITLTGTGVQTVRFYSIDKAGNIESTKSANVNVCQPPPPVVPPVIPDTTPPGTYASIPGDCQTPVNVSLFCTDSGSGCDKTYYCWDKANTCAASQVYNSQISFTSTGLSYVRYYSTDKAGNTESPVKSSEIRACNAKVELKAPENYNMRNVSEVSFKWLASGFVSNPDCNLHIGASIFSKACSNDAECEYSTTVPDGSYLWNVTCADV